MFSLKNNFITTLHIYDQQDYKIFHPKIYEGARNVENSVLVRLIIGLRNHSNWWFDFNDFAQILQTCLIQIKFYM